MSASKVSRVFVGKDGALVYDEEGNLTTERVPAGTPVELDFRRLCSGIQGDIVFTPCILPGGREVVFDAAELTLQPLTV
jgi:hypothetical protein